MEHVVGPEVVREMIVRMVKNNSLTFFAIVFCFASCSAYTNIFDLINVPMSRDVLSLMPTNDYTCAHKTLLSFQRAMYSGDFTNMYYCLSDECVHRNMQVTNISEVALSVVEDIASLGINAPVATIKEIQTKVDSSNRYIVVVKMAETKNGNENYERMRYELIKSDDIWKIDEWEDLLPGEDE